MPEVRTTPADAAAVTPRLFAADDPAQQVALAALLAQSPHCTVIDRYPDLLRELFTVTHPALTVDAPAFQDTFSQWLADRRDVDGGFRKVGVWAYYPWRQQVVHVPDDATWYQLRTARNHLLVTPDEQRRLREARIGVVGLSVGQAAALTLAISGIGRSLRLADPDTVDATNLNRIHASVADIGIHKTVVVGRRITELDPFATPDLWPHALTEETVARFLTDGGRLDAVVDAFDDLRMKVVLRQAARTHRVPVLMATDVGDGAILEIERYDLDPATPMFGGRVSADDVLHLPPRAAARDAGDLAVRMIGLDAPPPRMLASLAALGTELAGYPQLGLASFLGGAVVAAALKRLLLADEPLAPRVVVSCDALFRT